MQTVMAVAVVVGEVLGIETTLLLHPEPHTQWLLDQEVLLLLQAHRWLVQPVGFLHLTA
jgi:hypothetical protein